MSPNPSPDPDRVPATFEEARELILMRSWRLLTREQKTRVRNLFERQFKRTIYPGEIPFYAINKPEEGKP